MKTRQEPVSDLGHPSGIGTDFGGFWKTGKDKTQTYVLHGYHDCTIDSVTTPALQPARFVTAVSDASVSKINATFWPSIQGTSGNPDGDSIFKIEKQTVTPVTAKTGADGFNVRLNFIFQTDVAGAAQIKRIYYVINMYAIVS